MSIELLPGIGELDAGSLCYGIYTQLYSNFFRVQDKKDDDHPFGIEEGDETSIRLHNTAFGFAEAISGAVAGEGETGHGILMSYLKKSGGTMSGHLNAAYGFEGGIDNRRILELFKTDGGDYGARVTGTLDIIGIGLKVHGADILGYDKGKDELSLYGSVINLNGILRSSGKIQVGESLTGVSITEKNIEIGGCGVYHSGNCNNSSVDWVMADAVVAGSLTVAGEIVPGGAFRALYGVTLGTEGKAMLTVSSGSILLAGNMEMMVGAGMREKDIPILVRLNNRDVLVGAVDGELFMGGDHTTKIRLASDFYDTDGDNLLLTRYGAANFPDSLSVRHNYGAVLLSSYRKDSTDEGIVIHKKLRFADAEGPQITGTAGELHISTVVSGNSVMGISTISHTLSTSLYKPLSGFSGTTLFSSDTDFFKFSKPVEAFGHIGLDGSYTSLTDGCLFFSDRENLRLTREGIRHHGKMFFDDYVGSEVFSSGYAGEGWSITANKTNGNIGATFDEITVRRKMRVYEMEVECYRVTNGALWVSDTCSGDTVERL